MNILLKKYLPHAAIAILVIMYGVGLIGLGSTSPEWFLAATPLTLMLSAAALLLNHKDWSRSAIGAMLLAFFLGFGIELLGVKTGLIFGHYHYGNTLGFKVLDVPIVIGFNWLLLVLSTGSLVAKLRIPKLAQAALGAGIMTVLDVLIEPIAMKLGFWHWEGGVIPLQNFGAWFLIAFFLHLAFAYLHFEKSNPVAGFIVGLQFAFFGILNLMY
jgi:uncharacterized membrane protein